MKFVPVVVIHDHYLSEALVQNDFMFKIQVNFKC